MPLKSAGGKRLRAAFIAESVAILVSVVVAFVTRWRMPVSPWIAAPAGTALWACGLLYTLHLRKDLREAVERRVRPARKRGYPMVEARAAMHLGVALGFRSWPTLIVAAACLVFNLYLAVRLRRLLRGRAGRGGPRLRKTLGGEGRTWKPRSRAKAPSTWRSPRP